ncbi:GNAT family N-acetyltransferase [Bacillus sp. CECT 9360]|uniref:GNAT family N-acetyltransferase n=1 Tax=Bacillus sp. CECT 9360 TaxID=2845821 RepID=UPI001E31C200|nr:GNAT family N-acetyltransferase [Bacillus sp. CECT 9360]CAH0343993.1 IS1595 family transposase ISBsu3 [Bacillus sp. CECT 9360]
MEVAQASKTDLKQVYQHTEIALTEGTLGYFKGGEEKAIAMMEKVLSNNGKLLVSKESGQLAGWILYGTQADSMADIESGFIYELYILKDYRKKGYGKRLMEECIQDLKAQDLQEIRLAVYQGNGAMELYRQLGFSETRIIMSKKISG